MELTDLAARTEHRELRLGVQHRCSIHRVELGDVGSSQQRNTPEPVQPSQIPVREDPCRRPFRTISGAAGAEEHDLQRAEGIEPLTDSVVNQSFAATGGRWMMLRAGRPARNSVPFFACRGKPPQESGSDSGELL